MRRSVTVYAWYFLLMSAAGGVVSAKGYYMAQVGPFEKQETCERLRAWATTNTISTSASECWQTPAYVATPR
jgi:hypothetical protein